MQDHRQERLAMDICAPRIKLRCTMTLTIPAFPDWIDLWGDHCSHGCQEFPRDYARGLAMDRGWDSGMPSPEPALS